MILKPEDVNHLPKEVVGGKAWGLAKLASVARVPDFRLIVPDRDFEKDLVRLQTEFARDTSTYAVRSSAAVEDSEGASYAGLFLTILAAKASELPEAVERVVESGQTSRVKEFQQAIGTHSSQEPKVSVVIQEMIDASASGVALSFAPNTDRQFALVEAIFGLGEPLVGGKIPPDSWIINRASRHVAQYRTGHQVWKQMATERFLVPHYERNAPKLDDEQLDEVLDLLFTVETHFFLPADLEFCFEGRQLFALQARPLVAF